MRRPWFRTVGVAAILTAMAALWVGSGTPFAFVRAADVHGQADSDGPKRTDDHPVRYLIVPGESEARYRVRERIFGLRLAQDVVGRTNEIAGAVAFGDDGRVISDLSSIRVRLASLQSDQARRDDFVRKNALLTEGFPEAVFVPVEIRGLPFPLPEEGTIPVAIEGDLTIRDRTRRVEWSAVARFEPKMMTVEARISITFDLFDIPRPRLGIVLSVDETIRLEADVVLRKAG